jgi:ssDNA-specific exonuclease RecJ
MEVTKVGTAIKNNVKLNLKIMNGMHANHPAYNFYAIKLLESHADEVMTVVDGIEEIDPLLARELLKNVIIPKMSSLIDDCISQKLPINIFFKIKLYEMKWLDTYKDYASSARFYSMIHGTDELLDGINVLK